MGNDMKKILYIRRTPTTKIDGTVRYCDALHDMFANDDTLKACHIENYPTNKSLFFHYSYKKKPLADAIRQADIIHINGYTAMGTVQAFLLAKRYKKKIVYTAHWHPFSMLSHPAAGKLFFNVFLRSLIHRYADNVVCINNEDTAFFSRFCKNVTRIPHWFSAKRPDTLPEKKKNMVLFVGRVNDHVKGINYIYALPEGKYDIHCVGNGTLPQQRADITHHVNLSDEELGQLYAQASLLVIPSMYEAFSYVALEAFSYGTPVVMSDRVRIADYLDNVQGYSVFPYGNKQAFIDNVAATIGKPVDVETILSIFNPNRIRMLYKQLYNS